VFANHGNETLWATIPGTGSKLLVKRYAYAAFWLHPPVSMGMEALVEVVSSCITATDVGSGSHGLYACIGPGPITACVGALNVIVSWVAAGVLVEYVPFVGPFV
jgi:hypothetical protein